MSIRLIAFDLDGTLLTTDKRITEETYAALEEAAARGVYLVPCTGRLYKMVPDVVKELPFVKYMITVNGARIYDHKEKTAIYKAELPADVAESVFDYVETLPVIYDCYQDNEAWVDREFYDRAEELMSEARTVRLVHMRTPIENFRQVIRERKRPVEKIQMFFDDDERRKLELVRIAEKFPMCTIVSSIRNNIEVNARMATKGNTLAHLCEYLGIDLSECAAIGDGNNDISMLTVAGTGIAMDNAWDEVKKVADWTTGGHNFDGAAKAIRRLLQ